MWTKHRRIAAPLFLCLVLSTAVMIAVACGEETSGNTEGTTSGTEGMTAAVSGGKDEIVIGAARPLTGPLSYYETSGFGPCYKLWAEEVNVEGGIYVEEYGKKLPVRVVVEDDKSDLETSKSLLEKFMIEDQVDFVFSPATDEFIRAARDLTNEHGYLLLEAEGSSSDIRFQMEDYPLVFGMLNFSDFYQLARLKQILPKLGATTIAVIYPENDLHGAEYLNMMHHEADEVDDLDIIFEAGVPAGTTDFTLVLQQAQGSGADCLLVPFQPQENYLIVNQMIELGYNPNMLLMGPGTTVTAFADAVGGQANVDGICAYGAWSIHSSPELAALKDEMATSPSLKAAGFAEANVNYWYAAYFMAGLNAFKQAIEKAGTLDNAKVAEVLLTEHFQTLIGDTFFDPDEHTLAMECHPGEIGQWQNGIFEVIDNGPWRTAEPIYPKPPWPAP